MIISAIIDSRESVNVKRMTFGGVPTMVAKLTAGDLAARCDDDQNVLIERKTPSDLLGTLRAKRFLPQIEKMTGRLQLWLLLQRLWCMLHLGRLLC